MHAELVIPGLLAASAAARLPSLELLLARGRRADDEPQRLERWLAAAFELDDGQPLPAGALTALASNETPGQGHWIRADPVHLQLMRDRVVIIPAEALEISADEGAALCTALNAHFGDGMELHMFDPRRWYARLPQHASLDDVPALEVAGRPAPLRREQDVRLTEIQMVLHSHAVNERPINSLWLWGNGEIGSPASKWQSVTSAEPLSIGLARAARVRHRPLPAGAAEWLERQPEDGRHLVVLDALRAPAQLDDPQQHATALAQLERAWFTPLLDALRTQRIGMLSVHVPDAARAESFETARGDLRRFWRRPQPLRAYA